MSSSAVVIQGAVEGDLDEVVLRRLTQQIGADLGFVYGKSGKPQLRANIAGYNNAARHSPWAVLVDLDNDNECAATLRGEWLPHEASLMCFRVAVRQIEAWLLADVVNLAHFLGVSRSLLPRHPDSLPNAKQALIRLAERSNKRAIRETLPPSRGSRRAIGVLYNPTLAGFVTERWDPSAAARRSESLHRCLRALEALKARVLSE